MIEFLWNRLSEVKFIVLNYVNNKIEVDEFYNETMYEHFLSGINCRKGMGLYENDGVLEINKLNDGITVVIQQDGIQISKYKYKTIYEGMVECIEKNINNIKVNKKVKFKIRKNEFGKGLNYTDNPDNYMDFNDLDEIKHYLDEQYKNHNPIDWSLFDCN